MRRRLALLPLLLALGPGAAPAGAASRGIGLELRTCTPASPEAGGALVVRATMRTRPGAARLRLRFTLLARGPQDRRWRSVAGAGLDEWRDAAPAPARFVYDKRVEGLVAPARYRVRVAYRWHDAAGRRIAAARRTSAVCAERDRRADLRPVRLRVSPGPTAATRRYVLAVRNAGLTPAGPFATELSVGGERLAPQAATALPARTSVELAWTGPACAPGTVLLARVDVDGSVDEREEGDGELALACPAEPGGEPG